MSIKHWVYRQISTLCAIGADGTPRSGLRVLLYHSVGTRLLEDTYGTSIGTERFRSHMEWLASNREEWAPAPFGRPEGGKRRLSVTFDDGYKDTLTTAAPILQGLGLPFTVFVTAGFVGKNSLYLGPNELKELSALAGVSIGAHGDTHARLDGLDDAALERELTASRKYLEDLIGKPVTAIAYPHGAVDRRVRDAAQSAGYALGGCSRYGLNGPDRDPLLLCRTEVTSWDSIGDLALKVGGRWDWFRYRRRDPAGI